MSAIANPNRYYHDPAEYTCPDRNAHRFTDPSVHAHASDPITESFTVSHPDTDHPDTHGDPFAIGDSDPPVVE